MFEKIEINEVTDKMTKEKDVENIDENIDLQTPDPAASAEPINEPIIEESQFDILEITKNGKVTVLNVYGGCIVNTYYKGSAASVYVPGNHLRGGKIQAM